MTAHIIDGKLVSRKVKEELKEEVNVLRNEKIDVGLAVIIVGNNPASKIYVNNKKKACSEVGITSYEYALSEETTQEELLKLIEELNSDKTVDGILCQLPLPGHISEETVINAISPDKDVDCFHPYNVGKLMTGNPVFMPCTPAGVMELLKEANVDVAGKECVVVGRSNIVGKPQAMLLMAANGTVTVCHSRTKDLREVCKRADILVAAIGKAKLIDSSYVKEGAVVIDVGMNKDDEGKTCGDVDFDAVVDIASAITPVPGGVGPMTIAMLLKNAVRAAKIKHEKN